MERKQQESLSEAIKNVVEGKHTEQEIKQTISTYHNHIWGKEDRATYNKKKNRIKIKGKHMTIKQAMNHMNNHTETQRDASAERERNERNPNR